MDFAESPPLPFWGQNDGFYLGGQNAHKGLAHPMCGQNAEETLEGRAINSVEPQALQEATQRGRSALNDGQRQSLPLGGRQHKEGMKEDLRGLGRAGPPPAQ